MAHKKINQYELLHELGAGSGGVVYYATDTKLMRPVVIKMLHRDAAPDDKLRARMMEEARIASSIEHSNVCSIYEVGEHQGRPFIVMQYVAGQTLQHLIEADALNLHLALSIGIQIADGLAEAHRLGIVHRDLKPANIMITEGGRSRSSTSAWHGARRQSWRPPSKPTASAAGPCRRGSGPSPTWRPSSSSRAAAASRATFSASA